MRNGKTLLQRMKMLVVLAVVVFGMHCMAIHAYAAPELEATDSGAPSAMVIFPVSSKPGAYGAGMRPAVFNHLIHEQKIAECESCHHTGDMVSCTSCHTVEGIADGNFITLERAMHAENIAKRADGVTPASCVSCHVQNLERRECAGCHSLIPTPPRTENYCATCHDVTSLMTKEQFMQGVRGELDSSENEELAAETVYARKQNTEGAISPFEIPNKVKIDILSEEYEGSNFTHARHYSSLLKRIGDDKLAKAFHADPYALCAACHHESPASMTPPKCVSCHSPTIDPASPERPNLKAAYHLQCMGCHDAMDVSRPKNTSCTTCHKLK